MPHVSTGIDPATARNGYPLKNQLPEMMSYQDLTDIRQKDKAAKSKMKMYVEKWANVQPGDKLSPSDQVTQHGKLVSKFHLDPFEVIYKKGSMIIAQCVNEIKARNTAHFKRIHRREALLCRSRSRPS